MKSNEIENRSPTATYSQRLSDTRHTAHSTQLLICLNHDNECAGSISFCHRPAAKQIPPKFI